MVAEISKDKELTFSQKRGAVRIVFKKQDRHNLKYYRPITLLNTDVKIITKVLAMRLKKVLPSLIDHSQTCVPGRNITKNVHTLQDLIKYANSENISAAILFIDQEKASQLDSILSADSIFMTVSLNKKEISLGTPYLKYVFLTLLAPEGVFYTSRPVNG